MTNRSRSLARAATADLTATVARVNAAKTAEDAAVIARHTAARAAETARVKLTRADVEGAKMVRDRWGWHPVERVNTESVTVYTGPPVAPVERIPLARILEVRR